MKRTALSLVLVLFHSLCLLGTDLTVQKTANTTSVAEGELIIFSLVADNTSTTGGGPLDTGNVVVTDMLPPHVEFVSAEISPSFGSASNNGNIVTFNIPVLNKGQTIPLTVTARAIEATEVSTNTATISGPLFDPDSTNNSVEFLFSVTGTPKADLNVVKSGRENTQVNREFAYTIEVVNNGPDPASGVFVTETPPPLTITRGGLPVEILDASEFVVTTSKGTVTQNANGTYRIDIGEMAPDELVTITFKLRPIARGILENAVSVDSATPDPDLSNNVDVATTHVRSRTWGSTSGGHNGDPVATASGEFFFSLPDLMVLEGPMDLRFGLHYASLATIGGGVASIFGPNWSHTWDWTLQADDPEETVVRSPRGEVITFREEGDAFVLLDSEYGYYQLVRDNDQFHFHDTYSDSVCTFNAAGQLVAMHDTRGASLVFTYTGQGWPATVSDGLGRVVAFNYVNGLPSNLSDGQRQVQFTFTDGLLTGIRDPLGNLRSFTYTGTGDGLEGLIATVTSPKGDVVLENTYDEAGRVVRQVDGADAVTDFVYEPLPGNELRTVLELPGGATREHVHDREIQLISAAESSGGQRVIDYTPEGKRASVVSPLNETVTFTHEPVNGHIASIQLPGGTGPEAVYEGRNFLGLQIALMTEWRNPDGTFETFNYDASGNLASRTDAAGNTWTYTHNDLGQVLTLTNPLGGTFTRVYDAAGNLASQTDPAGNTVTFTYDSLHRMTEAAHPDGTTTTYAYDALNRVVSETTGDRTATATYDANSNLAAFDDNGSVYAYTYDSLDRLVTLTDPAGETTQYTYDPLGNPATITDPLGRTETFSYDDRGNRLSRTDGAGRIQAYTYDSQDRLVSHTRPDGETTTFAYDSWGQLSQVADPLGTTAVAFDEMGRLGSVEDSEGVSTRFRYSPNSFGSGLEVGNTLSSTLTRNALNRVGSVTDAAGNTWSYGYDTTGRLASMTDPAGQVTAYTYDSRSRLARVDYPGDNVLDFSYDPFGNTVAIAGPDGFVVNYEYDALDRLVAAGGLAASYDERGDPTAINGLAFAFDAARQLESVTFSNGAVASYTYDGSGRVLTVDYDGPAHDASVTFTYDADGLRSSLERGNGLVTTYTYDALNRLVRQTDSAGQTTVIDIDLTRDTRGDILSATRTQPMNLMLEDTQSVFDYNALNQVTAFTYDGMGRRLADDLFAYTYDPLSRLVRLEGEGAVEVFTYDGLGHLLSRTDSGAATTTYRWNHALDLPGIAEIQTPAGLTLYIHNPSGELLFSVNANDGVRYYHFDEQGHTLALTDAAGTATHLYAVTPYGHVARSETEDANPFTFCGQAGVLQLNDSHFFMRQRVYDNFSRQFLTPDPLAQTDPLKLNTYSYAAANPMRFIDPTGLNPQASATPGLDAASNASTGVSIVANVIETAATGAEGAPHLPGGSSGKVGNNIADASQNAANRVSRLGSKALDNLDGRRVNDLYDRGKELSNRAHNARGAGKVANATGNVATVVGVGAALGETFFDVDRAVGQAIRDKGQAYRDYFSAMQRLERAMRDKQITTREAIQRQRMIWRLLQDRLDGAEQSAEADIFYETGEGLVESLYALVPLPLP